MFQDFSVQIFADGAEIGAMKRQYDMGLVDGFTTNPSLMKKGGVTDYIGFAKEALEAIPDRSISFEVFADDFETMEKEARKIATFGENVFVKIPIVNTKGESSLPLIEKLSAEGVHVNVTAVYTLEQVKTIVDVANPESETYVSIFAGRLGDNGFAFLPVMEEAVKLCHAKANVKVLWASTREVWNVYDAQRLGVDIITCPDDVLQKLSKVSEEKKPEDLSIDTVVGFNKDIASLGFHIL